jgi:hypothetical protein
MPGQPALALTVRPDNRDPAATPVGATAPTRVGAISVRVTNAINPLRPGGVAAAADEWASRPTSPSTTMTAIRGMRLGTAGSWR